MDDLELYTIIGLMDGREDGRNPLAANVISDLDCPWTVAAQLLLSIREQTHQILHDTPPHILAALSRRPLDGEKLQRRLFLLLRQVTMDMRVALALQQEDGDIPDRPLTREQLFCLFAAVETPDEALRSPAERERYVRGQLPRIREQGNGRASITGVREYFLTVQQWLEAYVIAVARILNEDGDEGGDYGADTENDPAPDEGYWVDSDGDDERWKTGA